MTVTQAGTPAAAAVQAGSNTPSVTPSWGTGQNRTAGNLLVCAVSSWGGTTGGTPPTPSGWTQALTITGSSRSVVVFFTKTANGGDSAPTVSATNTGTATFATLAAKLYELNDPAGTPVVVTAACGTATGTTANPLAVTGGANVPVSGCYGLGVWCLAISAQATSTMGAGSGWTDDEDNGATSTRPHWMFTHQAGPASGSPLSESASYTNTGSFLAGAVLVLQPGTPIPGTVVQSVAGGQTATTFQVVTKLSGATSVRLAYSTASNMSSPTYVAAQVPDSMGYVRHTATGLAAKTRFYYQLADTPSGGGESLVGPVGQCKTLPASGSAQNFTVAFVSCVTQAAADPVAMDSWVAYDADLNIFTGDFDYSGTQSTTLATQVGIYETQVAGSGTSSTTATAAGYPSAYAQMTGQRWGFYCRSDHEAGPDNGDSNNSYTATNIAAAQQVFPFGTLGDQTNSPAHGLYQTWVAGRVRFIMLDIRNTDRSPGANTDDGSKTMLGALQLAWLKTQLIQPEPLKIIVSDVQWMGDPTSFLLTNGPDKWWSYSTERAAIISYIQANTAQVRNVMLWHGDSHLIGCTPPAGNTWGGFPVYSAAPMHNVGGGLDTGTFTHFYNNSGGNCRQYGRVSITDTGTQITVAFQGWDAVAATAQVSQTDVFAAAGQVVKATGTATVTGRTATKSVTDPRDATASVS